MFDFTPSYNKVSRANTNFEFINDIVTIPVFVVSLFGQTDNNLVILDCFDNVKRGRLCNYDTYLILLLERDIRDNEYVVVWNQFEFRWKLGD